MRTVLVRVWFLAGSLGLAACGDEGDRRIDPDCDASTCTEPDAAQEDGGADTDGSQTGDDDAGPGEGDAALLPDGCASELACPLDCDAACVGPTAGFSLSASAGVIPLPVRATSTAQPGDAPIVSVRYDFTGEGFAASDSHRYLEAGEYVVRQEVRDANGLSAEASLSLSVADFQPVRWSASDHGAQVFLSPDRLSVENRGDERGGARSDRAVQPGSGVFYFEAERLIDRPGLWGIGVATALAPLDQGIGSTPQSFGIDTLGQVGVSAAACNVTSFADSDRQRHYGFVVDYRGASANIYVLLEGATAGSPVLRFSCATTLTAPLFIAYAGVRYAVGYQLALNAGSDLTDFPFYFRPDDVRAAFVSAGLTSVAAALVPGFAQTRSPPADAAPVLTAPADRTVAVGTAVQLSATAMDAEDGDLTGAIVWTDLSSQHHAPLTGTGGSFSFTPTAIGRRPIAVSATDWDGLKTERIVMITVTGSLPQANPVRLVPDALSGPNIALSASGLQARFVDLGKYGIRANQAIYGQYWYFEGHRESASPENMGIGLVIPDGRLNPYDFVDVPWSCSINLLDSIWRNLISQTSYDTSQNHYGFAVDYRGLHPIVHFIVGGAYRTSLTLDDVWGPIYPMVYGDPRNTPSLDWDVTVNFGASAFQFPNAQTILNAAGVDTTGLSLGWGAANTP
jgi:hypothetical protein